MSILFFHVVTWSPGALVASKIIQPRLYLDPAAANFVFRQTI